MATVDVLAKGVAAVPTDRLGVPLQRTPTHTHPGPVKGSLYDLLGHRFADWKTAAGIIGAESRGDPNARSANPDGGENRGLFQIDTKTAVAHHLDPNRLFDPVYNTYAAWIISDHGTNWHAWATAYGNPRDPSTYLSADAPFQAWAKKATLPEADSAGPFGIPIDDSPANPFGKGGDLSITNPVGAIWSALTAPKTWLRVLYFIGGLLVGYFALVQLRDVARG